MTEYYPFILIDTGIIVAFYNKGDRYHQQVVNFFANCSSQLITTVGCITETMWLLAPDVKVQTEFLSALEKEVFIAEHLLSEDYQKIKQLNQIYQDLPADFTDLSLIAISERWFFGLCYAMDGGYKGCNPYIERHLAIFVNCF